MSGIYIHIPFCKQSCSYCNFHFSTSLRYKNEIVEAILQEILLSRSQLGIGMEEVETIYFGGGTPSLLTKIELEKILSRLNEVFSVNKNAEITLEANPDDLTSDKFAELKAAGINRISIGIQSFFDEDLIFMNRAHHAQQAKKSVEVAKDFFENITIDLIYGTPTMSNEQWQKNLDMFFKFGIPHLSAYSLTVETKTPLAKKIAMNIVKPIEDEKSADQFEILMKNMRKENYLHYEISNFSLEGYISKHNSSYWLGERYFGFGPSAHSFDRTSRRWNVANNSKYIEAIKQGQILFENEILTPIQQFNEYVMISLRTIWGCDLDLIKNKFGEKMKNIFLENSSKFIESGLIIYRNEKLRLSDKGKLLGDRIISDLFLLSFETIPDVEKTSI